MCLQVLLRRLGIACHHEAQALPHPHVVANLCG